MFSEYLIRWNLTTDGSAVTTPTSMLLPVLWADVPAVLKVAVSDEEKRGNQLPGAPTNIFKQVRQDRSKNGQRSLHSSLENPFATRTRYSFRIAASASQQRRRGSAHLKWIPRPLDCEPLR